MDRVPPAPADHQPIKAELEDDVRIDATPEPLGWVVTRCGAEMSEETRLKRIKGLLEDIAGFRKEIAWYKSVSYSLTRKLGETTEIVETTESVIAENNRKIAVYGGFIERLGVKDD